MKGLYFTDKHDHPFNEFSKPTKDGKTTLLMEHYATYDWIADQIRQHRPDFVTNLGDTVLTIGYVDALTITCVEYGDRVIRQACREVGSSYFPMLGNHDIMNDSTRIHVLPFVEDLITYAGVRDEMFFFPFYRDWEPTWKRHQDAIKRARRVFIHLDIVGASFNSASICKSGVEPGSMLGPDNRVIAGHFHQPQWVTTNFACIGSCMYRDFRDEVVRDPRGIIVEEFDGPGVARSWLRIENPCTSIYHSVKASDEEDLTERLNAIPNPERCHIRVSYPEAAESFLRPYNDAFRSIRRIPIKERRIPVVNGVEKPIDGFDPHAVVKTYFQSSPPKDRQPGPYLDYIDEIVNKVFASALSKKSRHHTRLLSLHAENFMPYLNLDLRFDENGVVYVDGVIEDQEADVSNGSGKSSIFEAIHWCWFGDLIRDSKELEGRVLVDDVVNEQSKSNCLVSIHMQVDGVEYQVLRTRKHREYGSDLRIFLGGSSEPTAQGLEQAKKYLTQITGADRDLFRHTTLLVDSLSTRFSQLSGRGRLELVESVIHLDQYDQLSTVVNQDMKNAKGEFDGVRQSLDNDARVLDELRTQRAQMAANLESLIQTLKSQVESKQQELSSAVDEDQSLDARVAALVKEAEQMAAYGDEVRKSIPNFDEQQYRLNVSTIDRDLGILRKTLQDKNTLLNGVCPTCSRPLATDPEFVKQEIELVKASLEQYEKSKAQWEDWAQKSKDHIQKKQAEYAELQSVYGRKLEAIRAEATQKSHLKLRINSLRGDIQSASSTLSSTEGQLKSVDARIATIEAEVATLKAKLQGLGSKLEVRVYWDQALSPKGGVRMTLLQDALTQLSEYSVDYSNQISNGRVSPQLFITPKGEIGFETQQLQGARKYGLSSSGQRRMVDLAIQLAIMRLSSKFSGFTSNILILDEVEDKLDASARRHLIGLLNKIAEEDQKVVMIASHNRDIKSFVEQVWLVTQKDGIANLRVAA